MNPQSSKKFRIGYPYPYLVPTWKQFSDIRIRLKTYSSVGVLFISATHNGKNWLYSATLLNEVFLSSLTQ